MLNEMEYPENINRLTNSTRIANKESSDSMKSVQILTYRCGVLKENGLNIRDLERGFSLIELIMTIVIMGILMATALPRFADLGRDARLASLKSMEGTLWSAASLLHNACLIKPSCSSTAGFFFLPYDGRTLRIINAYPEAGDVINGDQIDSIITQSGFDVVLADNLTTRFDLQGAPNPATCSVAYKQAANLGDKPTITLTNSGC